MKNNYVYRHRYEISFPSAFAKGHDIPAGSRWTVIEGSGHELFTQVTLDLPGHPLHGLDICRDYRERSDRPSLKKDRISAIIEDDERLSSLIDDTAYIVD